MAMLPNVPFIFHVRLPAKVCGVDPTEKVKLVIRPVFIS